MIKYEELESLLCSISGGGCRVLEIGAKPGGYLSHLSLKNIVRSNIEQIDGNDLVCTAEVLPFKDQEFNLVFMVAVDYYIPSVRRAFAECHRVLADGGVFVNATYVQSNLKKQVAEQIAALHSLSDDEYIGILSNLGFEVSIVKIVNNAPDGIFKSILWKLIPRNLKLWRSQWRIFVCKRKEALPNEIGLQ